MVQNFTFSQMENGRSTDQQDSDPYTYFENGKPLVVLLVLVINKSTPFWRATGPKFDFSTICQITKIVNQRINRILTYAHILEMESLR